uniref:MFS domain-containing protein n=1 Tax=Panagrellus redivivus TaxID=6233 RepID=A0A7E4V2V5_PANRE
MSAPLPSKMPPISSKCKTPIFAINSIRLHIGVLLMLGLFCATSMRVNMSMAVVCMVNETAYERERPSIWVNGSEVLSDYHPSCAASVADSGDSAVASGYAGTLLWTPKQISLLLSATFYGGLVTTWWSGTLADRVGPKMTLLFGVLDCVVVTALTPFLAERSFVALFVARLIMGLGEGFIFPSISSMSARWFPPQERSTFAAIYTSGNQLASVLGLPLASALCGTTFLGGWPSIFYVFSVLGISWCILWTVITSNSPDANKFISTEEMLYIHEQTAGHLAKKSGSSKLSTTKIPWIRLLTSLALFANLVAQISFNFSAALLQSYLPTYTMQVLRVPLSQNGIYTMLPFLTQMISKNIFGILSDSLKKKGHISDTMAVKVFQVSGNLGAACCFMVLAFFVDCTTKPLAMLALAFYGIFFSAGICGFFTSQLSIAPPFTGTVMSISMLFGTIGNAASPGLVGLLNKYGSEAEWRVIWILTAVINVIAGTFYLFFGTAEIQDWAKPAVLPSDKNAQPEASSDSDLEVYKTAYMTPDELEAIKNAMPTKADISRPGRTRRISDISKSDFP